MIGKPLDKPYFDNLGELGLAWTRECLENGEAFSRAVLSSVDLSEGDTFVVIAVQEHQEAVAKKRPLSEGSINRSAIDTDLQSPLVVDKLKDLEAAFGPLILLVEDNLKYPSDPIQRPPRHARYEFKDRYIYGKRVSEIQNVHDLDPLAESSSYPLNAFLTPLQKGPANKELNEVEVETIAASVLAILNAAYDGESYTIWIKK